LPDPGQNFIHALSDFWSVFFKDTTQIQSFYKGSEINLGQLYLELLETVLGTSLRHAPVFSKQYYKQFTVGEDEVFFVEGASPDDDVFAYTAPGLPVVDVPVLMNRVVSPTRVLEKGRDFDVLNAALRFFDDPFDVDGAGSTLTKFPVRTVMKAFAAEYRDLLRRNWKTAGAKVGDTFRLQVVGGAPFESRITGVNGDTLYLGTTTPEYTADFRRKSFQVSVLRTPFDAVKNGLVLPDHPAMVTRFSGNTTDVALVPASSNIDFSAEPYYKGAWTPLTSYAVGDIVNDPGTDPVRAKTTHTSGAVYSAVDWEPLNNKYIYIHHPDDPQNDGLYNVASVTPTTLTLFRPAPFVTAGSMRAIAYIVGYTSGLIGSPKPELTLAHTFLTPGTVEVLARRKHDVYVQQAGAVVVKPANQAVEEGVDYTIDYVNGTLQVLSGWDPAFAGRISYEWRNEVVTYTHAAKGTWVAFTFYDVGDIAFTGPGNATAYTCLTANLDGVFDPTKWVAVTGPFAFDQSHPVRQLALWGADVLLDRETLYTNFGYLLAAKHPSSEQYRAFLRGVAQLFVIGPALERFESALNVMAGLPVIRDDGEVLRAYNNGTFFSATDGQTLDSDEGRDGTLTAATSQFSAPTATFYASDVGAIVRVRTGDATYTDYTVTAYVSPTTVVVTPPPADGSGLTWRFTHVALTQRFRTSSFIFTDADLNADIVITGATHARNNGTFRILGVENATTVVVDAPYGLTDETGLSWSLTRDKAQTITTSRAAYKIPYTVPVRPDIALSGSLNTLTFSAFETITDAFKVTDYLQDPTWWHSTSIPPELLALQTESTARRRASADMVEHRLSPLDEAVVGDFGLAVGVDDEGRLGTSRTGPATWFGANDLVLSFSPGVPVANSRDVGRYVLVDGPNFSAQFQIIGVNAAGTLLTLADFPPPEMTGMIPPGAMTATLAPLLFRRTIGFIMMDRFLKYHALRVEVHESTPIASDFIGEATALLREAKPAFTHVYFETPLNFLDVILAADDTTVGVGFPAPEPIFAPDPTALVGPPSLLQVDDAYRFELLSQVIPAAPGVTALAPVLPAPGAPPRTVRFHVVKGWFDFAVLVGGRRIAEGFEYTLDRVNGTVTVLTPLPGPVTFNYVAVILRTRMPGDPLDPGETQVCAGGADPTIALASAQTIYDAGLIDRAVQLTIGP
jgi:hypothetical protein